ncbi:hypothetical protein Tco_1164341 [Tanacetum coccineum]
MQKRINILENIVQRCQKQSLDFELQIQHEKERRQCESSLKTVCETSWISKMEKLENENVSLELKLNTAYPLPSDTAYLVICPIQCIHPNRLIQRIHFHWIRRIDRLEQKCMTRSSMSKLFTPYKEPEREFRSSRRYFKTISLDKLRSPDFNLLSDQEYSEEEEAEAMAETMEKYMSKTRIDYGSGVARPKIDNKDQFELKRQFLKEIRENAFYGSNNEDANEHIEKVLKIVDLFHVSNITVDQLML